MTTNSQIMNNISYAKYVPKTNERMYLNSNFDKKVFIHFLILLMLLEIYKLHKYFNFHICQSLHHRHPILPQFPLSCHKMSPIKVAWCGVSVKNMHSWSPSELLGPWGMEKLSYLYELPYLARQAKSSKLTSVFHLLPSCFC